MPWRGHERVERESTALNSKRVIFTVWGKFLKVSFKSDLSHANKLSMWWKLITYFFVPCVLLIRQQRDYTRITCILWMYNDNVSVCHTVSRHPCGQLYKSVYDNVAHKDNDVSSWRKMKNEMTTDGLMKQCRTKGPTLNNSNFQGARKIVRITETSNYGMKCDILSRS